MRLGFSSDIRPKMFADLLKIGKNANVLVAGKFTEMKKKRESCSESIKNAQESIPNSLQKEGLSNGLLFQGKINTTGFVQSCGDFINLYFSPLIFSQ